MPILDGTKEKQNEWARQAMERIQKENLAPTPQNYELFFHYFGGSIPDLKMALDMLTSQFGGLTQEQCTDLHTVHLGVEAEQRLLADANRALDSELQKVIHMLDQASLGTTQFNQTLSSFSGHLAAPTNLDQLKAVVTKVASETRFIADQNIRLQKQLVHSTQQMSELRYNLDKVRQESLIDPLTEVGNRKFFQNEIARLHDEAGENGEPLCLLMIDIDHFKKFNDTHGHLVGDQVLKLVGKTLLQNVKGRDVVARYGGEEFAILLPNTRLEDAERVANHLRVLVGSKKIMRKPSNETLGAITLSIGATQFVAGEDEHRFIERADSALYRAKQAGRDRVVADKI